MSDSSVLRTLLEMRDLLARAHGPQWVEHLDRLVASFQTAQAKQIPQVAHQALAMFGGMGSLSDLVWYERSAGSFATPTLRRVNRPHPGSRKRLAFGHIERIARHYAGDGLCQVSACAGLAGTVNDSSPVASYARRRQEWTHAKRGDPKTLSISTCWPFENSKRTIPSLPMF